MIDTANPLLSFTDSNREQISSMMERICAAAQPGAVYGQPVVCGNYTVITASEVASGGSFGSGISFGPIATSATEKQPDEQEPQSGVRRSSGGGGMGGGGGAIGRPVAIIVIGPDGVTVKPVFDITKIALTAIPAWKAILTMLSKVRQARRK
jgi:uncharacterized spore protein YtfJ